MKNYIAKKTGYFRYNFALWFIKRVSPALCRKIEPVFHTIGSILPRPSIKKMKQIFDRMKVIGAEIGVKEGFNAESILKELNVKRLYLIDIWGKGEIMGEARIYRNNNKNYKVLLKKYRADSRIRIIRDYSTNAVKLIDDNSLDFVYIDGAHDYDNVYNDVKNWTPKVKERGFIAGHDISLPDVFNAITDYCLKNKFVFCVKSPDWYFIKERGGFES